MSCTTSDYTKIIRENEQKVKSALSCKLSSCMENLQAPLGYFNLTQPLSHKHTKTEKVNILFELLLKHDFLVEVYINAFQKMSADPEVIMILMEAMRTLDGRPANINQGNQIHSNKIWRVKVHS